MEKEGIIVIIKPILSWYTATRQYLVRSVWDQLILHICGLSEFELGSLHLAFMVRVAFAIKKAEGQNAGRCLTQKNHYLIKQDKKGVQLRRRL